MNAFHEKYLRRTRHVWNVVFHDSCYLGRYNGIYEAPREVIALVTGRAPAEMELRLEKSFCCGAGSGRMGMEESAGTRINLARCLWIS